MFHFFHVKLQYFEKYVGKIFKTPLEHFHKVPQIDMTKETLNFLLFFV